MSFQLNKSFVCFRNTIQDILDKNRESCNCPIDCQVNNTVKVQKSITHRTQTAYALLYPPQRKDAYSMCIYTLIWIKIAHPCVDAVRCLRSMGNIQNGTTVTRRDREETICWKKLFLFSLRTKSILIASYNSYWTTDGRWTTLAMLFILFWTSTVLFTWRSMGQSQASRFYLKYLKLCSEDKRSFYGVGTTCG